MHKLKPLAVAMALVSSLCSVRALADPQLPSGWFRGHNERGDCRAFLDPSYRVCGTDCEIPTGMTVKLYEKGKLKASYEFELRPVGDQYAIVPDAAAGADIDRQTITIGAERCEGLQTRWR